MILQPDKSGEWRRYTWTTPFTGYDPDTDEILIAGVKARHERNGSLIQEKDATWTVAGKVVTPANDPPGTVSEVYIFVRFAMPVVVSLVSCVAGSGETKFINFSDGDQAESSDTLINAAPGEVQTAAFAKKILTGILGAKWDNGNNVDVINGATCSIDVQGDTQIIITLPN